MEIKTKARRWGSSLAVILPKSLAEKQRIREDEQVTIIIEKTKPKAGALFGKFTKLRKRPTQELKDEARKGWESDSDRKRWK